MPIAIPARADTLVIGGGTAGAVIAGLLAERTGESIVLLEAGPDYGPFDSGRWPADLLNASDLADSHGWGLHSGSQYGDRVIQFQRARVIGGCSSHNGCAAIWGSKRDYDGWAAAGNDGWSTDDLLPFFENANRRLRVQIPADTAIQPFLSAFLAAAPAVGIPRTNDLNRFDESIGIAPSPINVDNGIRWNTAFGYLDPVRENANLTIVAEAIVDRVIVDHGRAVGARVVTANGSATILADRIVVSAGAYGSPGILMRSGIGNAGDLAHVGIEPVLDLPGVGMNLHDHPAVELVATGTALLMERLAEFAVDHWLAEEGVIAKARSSYARDDFDLHVYPVASPFRDADRKHWDFVIPVACMTPNSRGRLRIESADPRRPPVLDHGYLSDLDGADRRVLIDGVRLARELIAQPALRELIAEEIAPGPGIDNDEGNLARWIDANVIHYYHPVGSCKMGPAIDGESVVDGRGKVHGIEGLYVADASIMPVIPRANTNIPAAVVGERIASWLIAPT